MDKFNENYKELCPYHQDGAMTAWTVLRDRRARLAWADFGLCSRSLDEGRSRWARHIPTAGGIKSRWAALDLGGWWQIYVVGGKVLRVSAMGLVKHRPIMINPWFLVGLLIQQKLDNLLVNEKFIQSKFVAKDETRIIIVIPSRIWCTKHGFLS